ncbi:MAG: 3-hydroxyacyl-CoA dehydrogenase NAD-binding domain-containing protein [Acetobacteraceae bacterium]
MTRYEGVGTVGVIGTGTIGASWAAYFLSRGLAVRASDPAPDAADRLTRFIDAAWPALTTLGLAEGADRSRVTFAADPVEAVAGCDFIQESGPDRVETKEVLLERIGAALPAHVIIASSSSNLMPSQIQARCPHPERVVVGHPFNPPHLIPLVEVCGGARTSADAVERAMAFYRAIGKRAIRLNKEMPGHVSNRLQAAIWREAAYLVEQGVVNVADVDAAVCQGPGIRWAMMGPILTYHLAGGAGGLRYLLDHIAVMQLWPELGTPAMTPEFEQKLIDGVQEEVGGKSIPELAAWRDQTLVAVLRQLRGSG